MIKLDEKNKIDILSITDLKSVDDIIFQLRVAQKTQTNRFHSAKDDSLYVYTYFDTKDYKFKVIKSKDTIYKFSIDGRPNKDVGKSLFDNTKTDNELADIILESIKYQYLKSYSKNTQSMISEQENIFKMYEQNKLTIDQIKSYPIDKLSSDMFDMLKIKSSNHQTKYPEFFYFLKSNDFINIDIYKKLYTFEDYYKPISNDFLSMLPIEAIQEHIRTLNFDLHIYALVLAYADNDYLYNSLKYLIKFKLENDDFDLNEMLDHLTTKHNSYVLPGQTPIIKRDPNIIFEILKEDDILNYILSKEDVKHY